MEGGSGISAHGYCNKISFINRFVRGVVGPGVSSHDFRHKISLISCFFFLGGGEKGGSGRAGRAKDQIPQILE